LRRVSPDVKIDTDTIQEVLIWTLSIKILLSGITQRFREAFE
jgi:hypothetical protein